MKYEKIRGDIQKKECLGRANWIEQHMKEIGFGEIFQNPEEISYPALKQEEQKYFIKKFHQLVRRRLKKENLWEQWRFLWRVYYRIFLQWQQKAEMKSSILEEAFSELGDYLKEDRKEEELIQYSEKLNNAFSLGEKWSKGWELDFYKALDKLIKMIWDQDFEINSFHQLLFVDLLEWTDFFDDVIYYKKSREYCGYERKLRYKQVEGTAVFAGWIADIQKEMRVTLSR